MKFVSKFLAGAALVAVTAGGFAAPAAAQYAPYPGSGGNVIVGAILNSILRGQVGGGYGGGNYGGGNYGGGYGGSNYTNERTAVDQCARAAEARLNGGYNGNYNGGYNGQNNGYGGGYSNSGIRVNQIERVERTRNGNFRVYGWAGQAGWQGNYGGNGGGYNSPYGGYGQSQAPQFAFSCKVDRRSGRVTDIDVNRQRYAQGYYRGY